MGDQWLELKQKVDVLRIISCLFEVFAGKNLNAFIVGPERQSIEVSDHTLISL